MTAMATLPAVLSKSNLKKATVEAQQQRPAQPYRGPR